MDEWMPIADAPRDQRSILCVHENSRIQAVSWRAEVGAALYVRYHGDPGWRPTHFQYLKPPPVRRSVIVRDAA